ncbi:hypothetical protein AK88_01373 [Plasmodium fragile]|uniref:Uncharacterized protein n=1 Tax=Plasmodium fragile TaxID=5857 RepID=A0A0D9QP94_PLAFR|nr:uncharacterized protein AK88_01373 [Plasmodium fragile]KJP88879.1 hypothetical protein AK88_01373 [Plasmodium fragile]
MNKSNNSNSVVINVSLINTSTLERALSNRGTRKLGTNTYVQVGGVGSCKIVYIGKVVSVWNFIHNEDCANFGKQILIML